MRGDGSRAKSIFSTCSTGENRVTASFRAVLQLLSLGRIERKIVLIDGRPLADLMIDHDIGVTTACRYTVGRLDSDYFVEEDA